MKLNLKLAIAAATFGGAALSLTSVWAHHSTTMFDHAKTLTIDGEVVEMRWVNPHVSLSVNGKIKDSEEQGTWTMEMTSPGNLVRAGGWSRNSVKTGEKVQVDFSPLRDTSLKGGALKKITILSTGQVLTANIRAQEMPGLE